MLQIVDMPVPDEAPCAQHHHHVAPWSYYYLPELSAGDPLTRREAHFAIHEGTGDILDIAFRGGPMTYDDFQRWVELGCSEYQWLNGFALSWNSESIAELHRKRQERAIEARLADIGGPLTMPQIARIALVIAAALCIALILQ